VTINRGQIHALGIKEAAPTEPESGWTSKLLWALWKKEKYLAHTENQTMIHLNKFSYSLPTLKKLFCFVWV
jgi:hypothetical protein